MQKVFVAVLFMCCVSACFAADRYPFKTTQQATQFATLTEQLRCLVCQNESIADSNAGLAADLRKQVYEQVLIGKSNQAIIQYLVARYGDFVRFDPPVDKRTYVLWYGPFAILVFGFVCLFFAIRRFQQ